MYGCGLGRWRMFQRQFIGRHDHLVQQPFEFFQSGGRNDDRIAFAANFFGDTQEAATRILLERQVKRLAFNPNLLRFECVFLNEWTRWRRRIGLAILLPIRLAMEGRGPLI